MVRPLGFSWRHRLRVGYFLSALDAGSLAYMSSFGIVASIVQSQRMGRSALSLGSRAVYSDSRNQITPHFPRYLPGILRAERSDGAVLAFYPSLVILYHTPHQDVRVHHNTHPSHVDHGHPILYRCLDHTTDSRCSGSSKSELQSKGGIA